MLKKLKENSSFIFVLFVFCFLILMVFGLLWFKANSSSSNQTEVVSSVDCSKPPIKHIDSENLVVIYVVPEGCVLTALPLLGTVPPFYGDMILAEYLNEAEELPSIKNLPSDWYQLIIPNVAAQPSPN